MGITKKKVETAGKKPRGRPPKTRIITITKSMDFLKKVDHLNLQGNVSEQWRIFKQNFEYFYVAAELEKKSDSVQAAILLNALGPEAVELFNTFQLTDEQRKSYKEVLKAFESFCKPKSNEAYASYKFHTRDQNNGEPFDAFLMEIKKLVRECNFGEQESRMLRDRIILGVHDKGLQKRLLETEELDQAKAIQMARAAEASKHQSAQIQGHGSSRDLLLNAVSHNNEDVGSANANCRILHAKVGRTYKAFKGNVGPNSNNVTKDRNNCKNYSNNFRQKQGNSTRKCIYCGQTHTKGKCPAWNKICTKCGRRNHFASVCLQKQVREIIEHTNNLVIDSVSNVTFNENSARAWYKDIKIKNEIIKFKLDTGAEINILPFEIFNKIKGAKLSSTDVMLEVYGGMKLKPKGSATLDCIVNNKMTKQNFIIVNKSSMPILGLQSCLELGLVMRLDQVLDSKNKFLDRFAEVFEGLGKFKQEYRIKIRKEAIPIAKPARRVPMALLEPLRDELNSLCQRNIIEEVNEPAEWVSNLVIVEKKNKNLRLCLDPKYLNEAIIDEPFPIPTFDEISAKLANKKFFTVLDLKEGYWQVALDEESSKMCTFSTPFGLFRFKRLPFGIKCAPEVFQKLNERNFSDISGVIVYIDDVLIAASTREEHDAILEKVIKRAQEQNIKFNREKIQYCAEKVHYLGHIISGEGIKYDPEYKKAIDNLNPPRNKKELQVLLGMVNYVRKFVPNLAEISQPLRVLLKKDTVFQWLLIHDTALQNIKNAIANAPFLQPLDVNKDITIQADASQFGLGCCLMQDKKPVYFASRSLTSAECNYAQIEKELLAIIFACTRFHQLIYGHKVTILTDHKPLLGIDRKELGKVNSSRLQRMKLRLLKYNLQFQYTPGKEMLIADLLSRNFPITENGRPEIEDINEVVHTINMSDEKREMFKKETSNDPVLKELLRTLKEGWPKNKSQLKEVIKYYWKFQTELSLEDELVFSNDRVIVPSTLRQQILDILHSSHFGIEKTKLRARSLVYWPGINRDIEEIVAKCSICQRYRKANIKEPLLPHEVPLFAYFKIGMDIFELCGKSYLVVADYFSKYFDIFPLRNKTATEVISKLKESFSVHGIPREIIADNVPFGSYLFQAFARENDIRLTTTSPRYPQSNGFAEKFVEIAKSMLTKCKESKQELWKALLDYRNTPVKGSLLSPAELNFGRKTRSLLPAKLSLYRNKFHEEFGNVLAKKNYRNKAYYDKHARERLDFEKGEEVWYVDNKKWELATIVEKATTPRSYWIKIANGNVIRRNSKFLRHTTISRT